MDSFRRASDVFAPHKPPSRHVKVFEDLLLFRLESGTRRFSARDSLRWSFGWSSFLKTLVLRTR